MPLTIVESREAMRSGRVSSVALVSKCLDRIKSADGEGPRTFLRVNDGVLSDAAGLDAHDPRPLSGVPISIKDLFDEAGVITTAGSVVLAEAPAASRDAEIIRRLRAAGALIIGRTNMTEFAFSGLGLNPHYGTPRSPFERAIGRIPGGSSSGAAVSVCDGMAIAAIGTDTGGSTRIPAAFCGLVGFKPTVGRIPTEGVFPLAPTFDSVGPIAWSVADCRILDQILSGIESPVIIREPRSLHLGVATGLPFEEMDAAVATTLEAAFGRLTSAGVSLEDTVGFDWSAPGRLLATGQVSSVEARACHDALFARRAQYDPRVAARIAIGEGVRAVDYVLARQRLRDLQVQAARQFDRFDALLLPTVSCVAPAISELATDEAYFRANTRVLRNTVIANALGLCAITIPIHAPKCAPVGLMLMGPPHFDSHLLDVATVIEGIVAAGYF